MKVKELVEHLLKMDQELEVYSSADSEGNYYNSVYYEPTVMLTPKNPAHRIEEVFNDDDDEIDDCGYDRDELTSIVVI